MFQNMNVRLYAKFGDLKPTINKKRNVLEFGPVSEQGTETTFHKKTPVFFQANVS